MDLAQRADRGRDSGRIDDLLTALAELRELDRKRQAHAPGSSDYEVASTAIDRRSQQLMDWFRGLAAGPAPAQGARRAKVDDPENQPPRQARPE